MIDDFWTSLKASLYERTTSPLFGALALSWLAWNYRLLFVLFSGESVTERFALIDEVLYPDLLTRVTWLLVLPTVTAFLVLVIYPHPAKWVFRYWRIRQKELKVIRQKIEDETPLTVEESRRVRGQLIRVRSEYERLLREASDEAEQLRSVIAKEQELVAQLKQQVDTARLPDPRAAQLVQHLDKFESSSEVEREEFLSQPITHESVLEYSRWRYPELPPSADVTDRLLADIDRQKYSTLRDIHLSVDAAEAAVNAYAEEMPDYFKFGTDWITKSLGFTDVEFRKRHGFAQTTRAAFDKYQDLVATGRT